MNVKQKDILNTLKPYTMQILNEQGVKVIKMDEFLRACIETYKLKTKALNVKYNVEYLNKNESEVLNGKFDRWKHPTFIGVS